MTTDDKPRTWAARDGYLRETAYVVFKRKGLIVLVFVLVLAGVGLKILTTPPQWEASALLLIRHGRGELLVTPDQGASGAVVQRTNLDQDVNSEAELLKRSSLLARVVQVLGADVALGGHLPAGPGGPAAEADDLLRQKVAEYVAAARHLLQPVQTAQARLAALFNPPEPMPETERAVLALGRSLNVTPVFNSGVIKVTFAAEDPRFAQGVLDLLVRNYLEQYVQLRAQPGAVRFFERQTERLRRQLQEAEEALRRFEAREGVMAVAPQREMYLRTALDRETALLLARSEVEELRERSRETRARLTGLPERVATREEVRVNPLVTTMRQRLLDLELERNKLLQKYTESDRRVTDLEREIGLLHARYQDEPPTEMAAQTYAEDPVRTSLMNDLVSTEMQLVRAAVKARHLEREVSDFRGRLDHLGDAAYERLRLERAVRVAEEAYLLYTKKADEARIAQAMDESRLVNVALADPVRVAPQSGARGGMQLALLGGIVGLVAGVGAAFAREYFNPALTTEDSVRHHLGLPVLASVPNERT